MDIPRVVFWGRFAPFSRNGRMSYWGSSFPSCLVVYIGIPSLHGVWLGRDVSHIGTKLFSPLSELYMGYFLYFCPGASRYIAFLVEKRV